MKKQSLHRYLLVLSFILLNCVARATNYYVDAVSGNDTWNGLSVPTAFKTIGKGLSITGIDTIGVDTLFILPGTYPEKIAFQNSYIVVMAYDAMNRPVILPNATPTTGPLQVMLMDKPSVTLRNIVFDGLVFDGINLSNRVIEISGDNVTFKNCEIRNGYQSGFLTLGSTTQNLNFINLHVHHNGRENEGSHGFYLVSPHMLIENCDIHDNGGYGIKIGTNFADNRRLANYVTIRNNKVYSNLGKSGIGINHVANDVVVYNNVCTGNGDAGIDISYNTSFVKVFNNTIFGNNSGIAMNEITGPAGTDMGVDHAEIANNILYGNDLLGNLYISFTDSVNPGDTSDINIHDNFFTNPLFVNRHAGDFRLVSTSAALSGAVDIAATTPDILGDPRTSGSYSFGAYEEGVSVDYRDGYYVDSLSGNDTNDGTFSSPYRTINKGLSVLVDGDFLYVMNGTYNETINTFLHGTPTRPITIMAYPGHSPKIAPGNIGNQCIVGFRYYNNANIASYLVFDGFSINCMDTPAWGILFDKSHHITVRNCEVTNSKAFWPAIHSRLAAHHLTFDHINVHDNRSIGMYLTTDYNTIQNSQIHHNPKEGVIAGSYATVIANNTYNNTYYGIGVGTNSVVYNNVSWNNSTGISVGGSGSKVYNNTITKNSEGLDLMSGSSTCTTKNNIVVSNTTYNIINRGSSTVFANNYTSGNPQFVNSTTGDFHLLDISPVIDKGVTLADVLKDYDGNDRPSRKAYDIGAFENVSMAHDYYVDSLTGNDTNSGTWTYPFRTINKGIDVVGPGDILYVKNGTYVEVINTWKQGTATDPITIMAYPGHHPVIQPSTSVNQFVVGFRQYPPSTMACYIIFDGFIIDAANNPVFGILYEYAHHITIRNCEIKNTANTWAGIYTRFSASNNTFENLHIHDNGNIGIYFLSSDNTVKGCDIHNNTFGGIGAYQNTTITGNKIYSNTRNGIYGASSSTIYNNVIWGNVWYAIQVSGSNSNVYNNTCVGNGSGGIWIDAASTGCNLKNNMVISNTSSQITNNGTGNTLSNNFTTGSPDFVDATNHDYHLLSTSTAIDAGTDLSSVFTTDYDGASRTTHAGGVYDIGAFEYYNVLPKRGETASVGEEAIVTQQMEETRISVYPNPVTSQFRVIVSGKEQSGKIEVYNMIGQVIVSHDINTGEKEVIVDSGQWEGGIYFLRIHRGNETITTKIIKSK